MVLYVVFKRSLYATLCAALLLWQCLSSQLQEWSFILNPYDVCVVNKTMDNHQCTIVWHMDDLKISHVYPDVVTNVIDMIQGGFGKQAPLMIKQGKVHPGKVVIEMFDYI